MIPAEAGAAGMGAGGAAAIAGAAQVTSGLVGLIGQKKREKRALANQMKLMDLQFQNQQKLNTQGRELQQETWEKTNYPAQMAMLKEAGLNPGLMYGNGGPGGVTGSQGGGSASGGNAPAPQQWPMDIGNAVRAAMEAKVMSATARKANAEAEVIETYGGKQAETQISEAGYRMENLAAVTENQKAQNALIQAETEWKNIQNNIAKQTTDELIKQVTLNNQKLANDIVIGGNEAKVGSETIDQAITQIKQATIEQGLKIALTKEQITKTQEETEKISKEISVMCTEIVQKWTGLSQEQQKIELQKITTALQEKTTKMNTNWAAKAGQVTGIIGNIIRGSASIGFSTSNVNVTK